jgi:aspartokinase
MEGPVPWEVHKFGGAALANAGLFKLCGDLALAGKQYVLATTLFSHLHPHPHPNAYLTVHPALCCDVVAESKRRAQSIPTAIVVSAAAGVTDSLLEIANTAKEVEGLSVVRCTLRPLSVLCCALK